MVYILDKNGKIKTTLTGGGGGDATASNQTSGAQKTQIVDAGGEQATVTGGRLDVNATVTPSGTQNVDVVANTIGLATAAKQDTLLTELQLKADLTETQPVSAASLPLPTNASTSALQTTGNTSLSSIDTKLTSQSTAAKQDAQTALLTTIDADTSNLDVALSTRLKPADTLAAVTAITNPVTVIQPTAANLNTTEASAASILTGVQIMDDWDEADRAKVNLIVGQAGIAAGTGVDGVTVPRVTLATNVSLPAGTNNIGDVDIVSSALPTGASTLVEQQTQTTALQLIDDTVATDGAATPTKGILIAGQDGTNAQTIKTDTDGNLQVDVLTMPSTTVTATDLDIRDLAFATDKVDASGSVLGAGTNNIGDVDVASIAAGDNNIGNVDIVTMPAVTNAGTFAVQESGAALTALQLIDDTVFTDDTSTHTTAVTKGLGIMAVANPTDAAVDANDIGMVAMTLARAMKNDITTIAGTAPTTAGKLDVKGADGDVFVRQATAANLNMTEASAASALTSLQLLDDVVATLGTTTYTEASTKGNIIGAVRRDANTSLVDTTNEIAPLQLNATGELKVAQIQALPAGNNNIGDVDIVSGTITTVSTVTNLSQQGGVAISLNTGIRDTGTQRVTIATNDVVPVTDNSGSLTVDAPIGTPVNVQIGNATLAAGVIDETGAAAVDALAIGGGTAHDAVDSGNPVKIGGVAVSGSATPTSVAAADRVRAIFNQHGIQYTMGGHPNLIVREFDFGTAAQTDLNLAAAVVAADERIYVTRFEALCDNANTVAVSVRCGFGTASVPTASATGVSGMIASHPGIAAGSGIICGNGAGILAVGAAGEEPRLTSSAATTGNLHVIIAYYLIDETP